jgi:hypothetical protein
MTPRDKIMLAVSLLGPVAIVLVIVAGQLGFAYWWSTLWVVGVASIVGVIWIDERRLAKAFVIVVLLAVGCLGWAVPLSDTNSGPAQGFSIAPLLRAAGVTLWRLLPFGIVIAMASPRRRRR